MFQKYLCICVSSEPSAHGTPDQASFRWVSLQKYLLNSYFWGLLTHYSLKFFKQPSNLIFSLQLHSSKYIFIYSPKLHRHYSATELPWLSRWSYRQRSHWLNASFCKFINTCLHGKQNWSSITHASAPGALDALHLNPGDCVSGDQVESTAPGLIPTYHGTPTTDKIHAGTLFVDHASRFLHFTPHISTGSQDAIGAKHRFEFLASNHNRIIKCYQTGNGVFSSKDFWASCTQQHQQLSSMMSMHIIRMVLLNIYQTFYFNDYWVSHSHSCHDFMARHNSRTTLARCPSSWCWLAQLYSWILWSSPYLQMSKDKTIYQIFIVLATQFLYLTPL